MAAWYRMITISYFFNAHVQSYLLLSTRHPFFLNKFRLTSLSEKRRMQSMISWGTSKWKTQESLLQWAYKSQIVWTWVCGANIYFQILISTSFVSQTFPHYCSMLFVFSLFETPAMWVCSTCLILHWLVFTDKFWPLLQFVVVDGEQHTNKSVRSERYRGTTQKKKRPPHTTQVLALNPRVHQYASLKPTKVTDKEKKQWKQNKKCNTVTWSQFSSSVLPFSFGRDATWRMTSRTLSTPP